uniref:Uncharacterized protein n=1 Tax=Tetradesmus obliquus TaxID=3088 RepID=A0A383VLE9_TETOB|eukprot:jgi/Sobl393_1/5979/SZX65514.1
MSEDHFIFTSKFQSRIKALTVVATMATLLGCLTADWEDRYGERHVFSEVKPAIKRFFNELYGVNNPAATNGAAPQGSSSSSSSSSR